MSSNACFKLVAQAFSQQATIAHRRPIFTASHYGFSESERPNLFWFSDYVLLQFV